MIFKIECDFISILFTVGLNVPKPILAFYSQIHTSNEKKKNAKKEIANPKISTIQ